jgi:hypothetical protein
VRFAICSLFAIGCTATAPAPLPPPRVFPAPPETAVVRPVARELSQPVEEPTERHRYTEWVILADVMTIPLTFTWLARSETGKQIWWGVPVVVATPAVHAIAGNTTMALVSLPTRAATYGLTYYLIDRSRTDCVRCNPLPFGSILAIELAVVLTTTLDVVLAYVDKPIASWRKLPIVPAITPTADRGTMFSLSLTL